MNNLHQYLDEAARMYYAGSPIISDEQFDYLAKSINYNKVVYIEINLTFLIFLNYSLKIYKNLNYS